MIRSMTGFAFRDIDNSTVKASFGLKSYNNRYLELTISLPPPFIRLEPKIREYLSSKIIHGKVDFSMRLRSLELPGNVAVDVEAARNLVAALRSIRDACSLAGEPALADLLHFDGIISFEKQIDEDLIWKLLYPEIEKLFLEFDESRECEGAATLKDIHAQLERISVAVTSVSEKAPIIEETVKTQLRLKFNELLGEGADQSRILAETAVLLVKYSINEEISRLGSHLSTFRRIITSESGAGKKLDFLCQEMNREINTIGSKNILVEVTQSVVAMKDALENIREQLRNIE